MTELPATFVVILSLMAALIRLQLPHDALQREGGGTMQKYTVDVLQTLCSNASWEGQEAEHRFCCLISGRRLVRPSFEQTGVRTSSSLLAALGEQDVCPEAGWEPVVPAHGRSRKSSTTQRDRTPKQGNKKKTCRKETQTLVNVEKQILSCS